MGVKFKRPGPVKPFRMGLTQAVHWIQDRWNNKNFGLRLNFYTPRNGKAAWGGGNCLVTAHEVGPSKVIFRLWNYKFDPPNAVARQSWDRVCLLLQKNFSELPLTEVPGAADPIANETLSYFTFQEKEAERARRASMTEEEAVKEFLGAEQPAAGNGDSPMGFPQVSIKHPDPEAEEPIQEFFDGLTYFLQPDLQPRPPQPAAPSPTPQPKREAQKQKPQTIKKHRKAWRVICQTRRDYRKRFDSGDTANPTPKLEDLRDALQSKSIWYSIRTIETIIAEGEAGKLK